jgi:hypothetical protein
MGQLSNPGSVCDSYAHIPTPRPCDCAEAERGTTVWQLYCHVVSKHSELLYV